MGVGFAGGYQYLPLRSTFFHQPSFQNALVNASSLFALFYTHYSLEEASPDKSCVMSRTLRQLDDFPALSSPVVKHITRYIVFTMPLLP